MSEAAGGGGGADTELKTKTPHVNVGKKIILGPFTDPATPRHISSRCRDQLACSVASHMLTIGVIVNLRYRYHAKKNKIFAGL